MRIFWLFNHPAPYKVEFFNRLGQAHELTVFFERRKESGRNKTFYGHEVLHFIAHYGKPLMLGGVNSYTRDPLKFLKNHDQYDLIVINGWRTLTERLCISYCKRHHIPYVFYINGGIAKRRENNFAYTFKRSYISGATFYMAPDEVSKEYLVHYGADPDHIILYPYGSIAESEVLSDPYSPSGIQKLRTKLGIQEERAFVTTGFFSKRKGFDRLISAWKHMPSDSGLYIIGEGKQKRALKAQCRLLGLKNVHVLPYMPHDELFRFYRACDAFVFPTNEDIYGHVVAEAMAQGLPVFSTRNSNAAKRLIQEGQNGGFIDLRDTDGLISILSQGITPEMKISAIETARLYTYEESARVHDSIFNKFLNEIGMAS